MVSDEASLTTLAQKWNGLSYWSPAIDQRGQFCPRLGNKKIYRQKDTGDRLISPLLKCSNTQINLVKVPLTPKFFLAIRKYICFRSHW